MDAFLDRVTQATRMRNAARKVCTPNKGHRIEDLTKLISGETYVAVGQEAFKNLQYGSIRIRRPVVQHREIKIEPVKHSRIVISARCRKVALWESAGLKTIYVYRNGDDKNPSHKILLDRRILLNMDKVLELVTDRVKLESGAVYALYTMLGKEIINTTELTSGEKYVAVGHGKRFKRTAYNDNHKVSPNNSPRRATVKYKAEKAFEKKKSFVLSSKTDEKPKHGKGFEDEGGKSLELKGKVLETHEERFSAVQSTKVIKIQTTQRLKNARTEETTISEARNDYETGNSVLTVQSRSENEQIVNDKGDLLTRNRSEENVFKASGAKSEQAKQVDDDKEVKIEKPIDQVPAEEVVEEIIDQNPTETEEQRDQPQEQVRPPSPDDENSRQATTKDDV